MALLYSVIVLLLIQVGEDGTSEKGVSTHLIFARTQNESTLSKIETSSNKSTVSA